MASSVFIRHTLNALYSDLSVVLHKVVVKTPTSSSTPPSLAQEEPRARLHAKRRSREKSLLVGFYVKGTSRVSRSHGEWEVNSTYTFSPITGLIHTHIVNSIHPAPHQAAYDSLRLSLSKVFGLGLQGGGGARADGAACSRSGLDEKKV